MPARAGKTTPRSGVQMLDAVAAGVALAFVVVVWAMHPSKGDASANNKHNPLDRTHTRKGGCM